MKEEDKRAYLESYAEEKKRGIPFFPDALFKDAVVSLLVFGVLFALAVFVGAELDERADPTAEFDPKPEWYFLFIFQLLKFFPGNLEFLGAVVLPLVVVAMLFALPWLDRRPRRHVLGRPVVAGVTMFLGVAALVLTFQAVFEEEPPSGIVAAGDTAALLYTENCSGCHGAAVAVPARADLRTVIASGGHEGMPAWSADLSTDEIDALAGFVLSPNGSAVFARACSECHELSDLVEVSPITLRAALEPEEDFPPHRGVALLGPQDKTALLNFLVAPDGQRLFALNCSECHGTAVPFDGSRDEMREVIRLGGRHLEMPALGGVLSDPELDELAAYVVNPGGGSEAAAELFDRYCATCHGVRVPGAASLEEARTAIELGGGHEDMPIWGDLLTDEQLEALTDYAFEASRGTPVMAGQELYTQYCVVCHGEFGEGGANPANPAVVISPISTASYLGTRDDATIRAIIAQGQPDQGMSPFSLAFGGILDEEDIDSVVAFIRSWEANPPVELPPEIERAPLIGNAEDIYLEFCAQCHGDAGEGGIGPSFQDPAFQAGLTDEEMFTAIDLGHAATAMIAWGEVLSDRQIQGIVALIRTLGVPEPTTTTTTRPPTSTTRPSGSTTTTTTQPPSAEVSFLLDVQPILEARCVVCHGSFGGWSAATYTSVMESGDNAPIVIAGDADGSILWQVLVDTGSGLMPPAGGAPLSPAEIQLIRDWIEAGALDN